VPHRTRKGFTGGAVQVTMRLRPDAPHLRRRALYALIRRCMVRSGQRPTFRVCHYSIQGNHVNLICEAQSQLALSRGMQGFASAMARRINRAVGRRGTFFDTRYQMRPLPGPGAARKALVHVLNDWRRHGVDHAAFGRFDPYSSSELFAAWGPTPRPGWLDADEPIPVVEPETWLLREGWRSAGAISPYDIPGRVGVLRVH
jgi:REP element-mobilizing transposase RayT